MAYQCVKPERLEWHPLAVAVWVFIAPFGAAMFILEEVRKRVRSAMATRILRPVSSRSAY